MAYSPTLNNKVEDLCRRHCRQDELVKLKNQFEYLIQSQRTLDWIGTIGDLIEVLKKRDELTVERLMEIDTILGVVNNPLASYPVVPISVSTGPTGYSAFNYPLGPNANCPIQPSMNNVPINQNSDGLRKVYKTICSEMGLSWREFARALECREADIDELSKNDSVFEITMKILLYHENNQEPDWRQNLLSALREARRSDLSIKVEKLLDRHNIIKP